MKHYFIIENEYNEYNSSITRICDTFEEALEEIKECHDWYCAKGTGHIKEVDNRMNEIHCWYVSPYCGVKQER